MLVPAACVSAFLYACILSETASLGLYSKIATKRKNPQKKNKKKEKKLFFVLKEDLEELEKVLWLE
jgi:hypothetical protein